MSSSHSSASQPSRGTSFPRSFPSASKLTSRRRTFKISRATSRSGTSKSSSPIPSPRKSASPFQRWISSCPSSAEIRWATPKSSSPRRRTASAMPSFPSSAPPCSRSPRPRSWKSSERKSPISPTIRQSHPRHFRRGIAGHSRRGGDQRRILCRKERGGARPSQQRLCQR